MSDSFEGLCFMALVQYDATLTDYQLLINSSLSQECPTGMVDEDSFKNIFSQFFPQGGK
jgi:hypothetical protein